MLGEFGIEPERLRLEWVSASEGARFAEVVADFTKIVKEMGPLKTGTQIAVEVAK
jgi:F420-non-reducing hydrogenase iron-sulfur subunit